MRAFLQYMLLFSFSQITWTEVPLLILQACGVSMDIILIKLVITQNVNYTYFQTKLNINDLAIRFLPTPSRIKLKLLLINYSF